MEMAVMEIAAVDPLIKDKEQTLDAHPRECSEATLLELLTLLSRVVAGMYLFDVTRQICMYLTRKSSYLPSLQDTQSQNLLATGGSTAAPNSLTLA